MSFYDEVAAGALEAIKEAGKQIPLYRFTKTLDPVTGGFGASTVASGLIDCVVVSISKNDQTKLDVRLVEALVQGRLRKLIVAASTVPFEPTTLDVVYFDDVYWIVQGVTPVKPADTNVIYTLFVEKGSLSSEDQTALNPPEEP